MHQRKTNNITKTLASLGFGSKIINEVSNKDFSLMKNVSQEFDLKAGKIPPNRDLAFVAGGGNMVMSFSICAKCGSTSLYKAIFQAIYGYRYNISGPQLDEMAS